MTRGTSGTNSMSFSERRKKLLESRGELPPASSKPVKITPPIPTQFESSIPDVEDERSEQDNQIKAAVDAIGILDAYRKWIGKEIDMATIGRDEVMVSCPIPSHRDLHPSAWVNPAKKTWFCGACQEGGDVLDIAAYSKGYDVPGYKVGDTFPKLLKEMAEDFGTHIEKLPGGENIVWSEDIAKLQLKEPAPAIQPNLTIQPNPVPQVQTPTDDSGVLVIPTETESQEESNVIPIRQPSIDYEDEAPDYPTIDWRTIVPENTFLREYLEACSRDDSPEEYHFWHGLVALGHATGRNVTLNDSTQVTGNLLVCLLGGTGYGKTRSYNWLKEVIRDVLPFKDNGLDTSGVKVIPIPGSGEFLVKAFQHLATDPALPKTAVAYTPVNGTVDFGELSVLLAKANQTTSSLKPTIMGFADCGTEIKIGSLTAGESHAYMPFCSMTASTQPKSVKGLLSRQDSGSGFVNRWIFAGGEKKERHLFGSRNHVIDLARAKDQLKKVRAYGAKERSLDATPDAVDAINKFFKDTLYPAQEHDSTDLLKRTDLMFKKLLLLFTINNREHEVTLDTFNRVLPLFDYLVKNYRLIDAQIGITINQEIAEHIITFVENYLRKNDKGPTAREISHHTRGKKYQVGMVRQTLDNLVAMETIVIEKTALGAMGRPTIRYRVSA